MPLPIPSEALLESLPTPSTVEESDPERKAERETSKQPFQQPNIPSYACPSSPMSLRETNFWCVSGVFCRVANLDSYAWYNRIWKQRPMYRKTMSRARSVSSTVATSPERPTTGGYRSQSTRLLAPRTPTACSICSRGFYLLR
jgi:hypothetical protein